jgi:hypothetical protein
VARTYTYETATDEGRICSNCGVFKSWSEFHKRKIGFNGYASWCKVCVSSSGSVEKWRENNPDKYVEVQRKCRKKAKLEVVQHYGGKCACCGETELLFLTMDHINNDGAKHRREMSDGKRTSSGREVGSQIYFWLRKNNFPTGFQILCWNCNCGRNLNGGVCPHRVVN